MIEALHYDMGMWNMPSNMKHVRDGMIYINIKISAVKNLGGI